MRTGVLLLSIFLLSQSAVAEEFEWDTPVYPRGPLVGQPIDDTQARPAKALTSEQAASYGAKPGDLMFGNYWYKGKFYIAHVPKEAVDRVILQSINFRKYKGLVRHMQLRFQLHPERTLTLYDQSDMANKQPVHSGLMNMVYSSEAVADEQWNATNPQRQSDGRVVLIRRFQDPIDSYASWVALLKNRMDQTSLDELSAEARQKMLADGVARSEADGYHRLYNWFHQTCVTDCFENIDAANPGHPIVSSLFKRLPYWQESYLRMRGLRPTGGFEAIPTFNDEFPHYKDDPYVRAVTRELLRKTNQERKAARERQAEEKEANAKKSRLRRAGEKVLGAIGLAGRVCKYGFLHLSGLIR